MKRILINVVLFVVGLVIYDMAQWSVYDTIELGWKFFWNNDQLSNVLFSIIIVVFLTVFFGGFMMCGLKLHSYFGKGKAKRATYGLDRGETIEMGDIIHKDYASFMYVIIYQYPFGEPRLFRFKQNEIPDNGMTKKGWKYIWDGKKLVSVKG